MTTAPPLAVVGLPAEQSTTTAYTKNTNELICSLSSHTQGWLDHRRLLSLAVHFHLNCLSGQCSNKSRPVWGHQIEFALDLGGPNLWASQWCIATLTARLRGRHSRALMLTIGGRPRGPLPPPPKGRLFLSLARTRVGPVGATWPLGVPGGSVGPVGGCIHMNWLDKHAHIFVPSIGPYKLPLSGRHHPAKPRPFSSRASQTPPTVDLGFQIEVLLLRCCWPATTPSGGRPH